MLSQVEFKEGRTTWDNACEATSGGEKASLGRRTVGGNALDDCPFLHLEGFCNLICCQLQGNHANLAVKGWFPGFRPDQACSAFCRLVHDVLSSLPLHADKTLEREAQVEGVIGFSQMV